MKEWESACLLVIISACYMPLFLYFSNVEEASFRDVFPILVIFSVLAIVLFCLCYLLTKSIWSSSLSATVGALLLTNYALLERLFFLLPIHLRYWHIVAILILSFIHLAYFISGFFPQTEIKTVVKVFSFVFTGLLIVNGLIAMPSIIDKNSVPLPKRQEEALQQADKKTVRPNVYYFIFDEFSNQAMIEKYYGYSNIRFFQTLEDLGFTISYDSKNMSYATLTVTANYMNYNYLVSDHDNSSTKLAVKADNATKKLFQQYGYDFVFIGAGNSIVDWGIAENKIETSTQNAAATEDGKTMRELILERTIVYPLIDAEGPGSRLAARINSVFDFFEHTENYNSSGNTYTLVYVESPHQPFVFNTDGTLNNPKNFHEWGNSDNYLHQYQYLSQKIPQMMKEIITNDPTAIIILQSDHSARGDSRIKPEDKTFILNAVYFGGEPIDGILGKSGVNTLRTVYSRLFGINLPDVEVSE